MRFWVAILGAFAGIFGACGVALAAAGAHLAGGSTVTVAAYFSLFHAAALVALAGLAACAERPAGLCAAATGIAAGTLLFSGDLALRGLAKVLLFHMAAPAGGMLMIGGWIVAAVAMPPVLLALAKRSRPVSSV